MVWVTCTYHGVWGRGGWWWRGCWCYPWRGPSRPCRPRWWSRRSCGGGQRHSSGIEIRGQPGRWGWNIRGTLATQLLAREGEGYSKQQSDNLQRGQIQMYIEAQAISISALSTSAGDIYTLQFKVKQSTPWECSSYSCYIADSECPL